MRARRLGVVTELEAPQRRHTETLEQAASLAERFFVQESYVHQLAVSKDRICYPDSVSVFDRAVAIAQHKLSGETDVNNTDANARGLGNQVLLFEHLGLPVEVMAVVPCAKKDSVRTRWSKALANAGGSWARADVFLNEDIWTGLFGAGAASSREYDRFLDHLADLGADRLFHCFAPDGVELRDGRWVDGRVPASSPGDGRHSTGGGAWLVEIPASAPPADVEAILELLSGINASVVVE